MTLQRSFRNCFTSQLMATHSLVAQGKNLLLILDVFSPSFLPLSHTPHTHPICQQISKCNHSLTYPSTPTTLDRTPSLSHGLLQLFLIWPVFTHAPFQSILNTADGVTLLKHKAGHISPVIGHLPVSLTVKLKSLQWTNWSWAPCDLSDLMF